jgi:hypothetical protein
MSVVDSGSGAPAYTAAPPWFDAGRKFGTSGLLVRRPVLAGVRAGP